MNQSQKRDAAVGAVLRKMSFERWAEKNGFNKNRMGILITKGVGCDQDDWWVELECDNYFGALSIYFEKGNSKAQCIRFVKKHFPPKLTVEIEGEKDDY